MDREQFIEKIRALYYPPYPAEFFSPIGEFVITPIDDKTHVILTRSTVVSKTYPTRVIAETNTIESIVDAIDKLFESCPKQVYVDSEIFDIDEQDGYIFQPSLSQIGHPIGIQRTVHEIDFYESIERVK